MLHAWKDVHVPAITKPVFVYIVHGIQTSFCILLPLHAGLPLEDSRTGSAPLAACPLTF